MTSPTKPPKQPLTQRLTQRISFGSSSGISDPEERFTRNVTIAFVAIIGIAAILAVVGLGYGYYDANLRPLANVSGSELGRGDWEARQDLEVYRLTRAEGLIRTGISDGSIDPELAERRLAEIAEGRQVAASAVMERLVDLTYQEQLAEKEGISLSEDELTAALAADGTAREARHVIALIIRAPEEESGLPATSEGRAEARVRAETALALIEDGAEIADLAEEYSPSTASSAGDLGYLERSDLTDPEWADAIFALQEGETTGIIEGTAGELLISSVTDIVPERPDPGFLAGVADAVGEDAHRRNVQLEALAAKLEDHIVEETLATDFEQVRLAEILVRGNTLTAPEDDEGTIRASHILYAPGDPLAGPVPEDDPGWEEARLEAEQAAEQLRKVVDPEARAEVFAVRAGFDSDGPTAVNGGDLGYFERAAMLPEFADAVFDDPDLQFADIVGPVRSDFGWHVIQFTDRKAPLADRLAEVEQALAADGADFSAVATALSDGPSAFEGGEMGWMRVADLDDLSAITLAATEVGDTTEPVEGDEGYFIYLKEEEAVRPLEAAAAARLAQTAFSEWYDVLRFEAEAEGLISIDDAIYAVAPPPRQRPAAPQAPMGDHPG
ncbi:MAG: peptidylprolyl isomerase [Chloroflexota bacterium]